MLHYVVIALYKSTFYFTLLYFSYIIFGVFSSLYAKVRCLQHPITYKGRVTVRLFFFSNVIVSAHPWLISRVLSIMRVDPFTGYCL